LVWHMIQYPHYTLVRCEGVKQKSFACFRRMIYAVFRAVVYVSKQSTHSELVWHMIQYPHYTLVRCEGVKQKSFACFRRMIYAVFRAVVYVSIVIVTLSGGNSFL
jgi:hypothetical protein